MEPFSALLALCVGNSQVTGEFPSQRPVTRSFAVFFHLCLNKRLSKQSLGWRFETSSCSLWRHCNDVPCIIQHRNDCRLISRTGCRFALNQWGTALLCNDISHWLGANLESALIICSMHIHNTRVGCNKKYQNLHIQIKTGSSYLLTNKAARILQNPLYCIYHNVSQLYPPLTLYVLNCFRGNINMYLYFVSFLHIDATQVVETLSQIKQEPTYSM